MVLQDLCPEALLFRILLVGVAVEVAEVFTEAGAEHSRFGSIVQVLLLDLEVGAALRSSIRVLQSHLHRTLLLVPGNTAPQRWQRARKTALVDLSPSFDARSHAQFALLGLFPPAVQSLVNGALLVDTAPPRIFPRR